MQGFAALVWILIWSVSSSSLSDLVKDFKRENKTRRHETRPWSPWTMKSQPDPGYTQFAQDVIDGRNPQSEHYSFEDDQSVFDDTSGLKGVMKELKSQKMGDKPAENSDSVAPPAAYAAEIAAYLSPGIGDAPTDMPSVPSVMLNEAGKPSIGNHNGNMMGSNNLLGRMPLSGPVGLPLNEGGPKSSKFLGGGSPTDGNFMQLQKPPTNLIQPFHKPQTGIPGLPPDMTVVTPASMTSPLASQGGMTSQEGMTTQGILASQGGPLSGENMRGEGTMTKQMNSPMAENGQEMSEEKGNRLESSSQLMGSNGLMGNANQVNIQRPEQDQEPQQQAMSLKPQETPPDMDVPAPSEVASNQVGPPLGEGTASGASRHQVSNSNGVSMGEIKNEDAKSDDMKAASVVGIEGSAMLLTPKKIATVTGELRDKFNTTVPEENEDTEEKTPDSIKQKLTSSLRDALLENVKEMLSEENSKQLLEQAQAITDESSLKLSNAKEHEEEGSGAESPTPDDAGGSGDGFNISSNQDSPLLRNSSDGGDPTQLLEGNLMRVDKKKLVHILAQLMKQYKRDGLEPHKEKESEDNDEAYSGDSGDGDNGGKSLRRKEQKKSLSFRYVRRKKMQKPAVSRTNIDFDPYTEIGLSDPFLYGNNPLPKPRVVDVNAKGRHSVHVNLYDEEKSKSKKKCGPNDKRHSVHVTLFDKLNTEKGTCHNDKSSKTSEMDIQDELKKLKEIVSQELLNGKLEDKMKGFVGSSPKANSESKGLAKDNSDEGTIKKLQPTVENGTNEDTKNSIDKDIKGKESSEKETMSTETSTNEKEAKSRKEKEKETKKKGHKSDDSKDRDDRDDGRINTIIIKAVEYINGSKSVEQETSPEKSNTHDSKYVKVNELDQRIANKVKELLKQTKAKESSQNITKSGENSEKQTQSDKQPMKSKENSEKVKQSTEESAKDIGDSQPHVAEKEHADESTKEMEEKNEEIGKATNPQLGEKEVEAYSTFIESLRDEDMGNETTKGDTEKVTVTTSDSDHNSFKPSKESKNTTDVGKTDEQRENKEGTTNKVEKYNEEHLDASQEHEAAEVTEAKPNGKEEEKSQELHHESHRGKEKTKNDMMDNTNNGFGYQVGGTPPNVPPDSPTPSNIGEAEHQAHQPFTTVEYKLAKKPTSYEHKVKNFAPLKTLPKANKVDDDQSNDVKNHPENSKVSKVNEGTGKLVHEPNRVKDPTEEEKKLKYQGEKQQGTTENVGGKEKGQHQDKVNLKNVNDDSDKLSQKPAVAGGQTIKDKKLSSQEEQATKEENTDNAEETNEKHKTENQDIKEEKADNTEETDDKKKAEKQNFKEEETDKAEETDDKKKAEPDQKAKDEEEEGRKEKNEEPKLNYEKLISEAPEHSSESNEGQSEEILQTEEKNNEKAHEVTDDNNHLQNLNVSPGSSTQANVGAAEHQAHQPFTTVEYKLAKKPTNYEHKTEKFAFSNSQNKVDNDKAGKLNENTEKLPHEPDRIKDDTNKEKMLKYQKPEEQVVATVNGNTNSNKNNKQQPPMVSLHEVLPPATKFTHKGVKEMLQNLDKEQQKENPQPEGNNLDEGGKTITGTDVQDQQLKNADKMGSKSSGTSFEVNINVDAADERSVKSKDKIEQNENSSDDESDKKDDEDTFESLVLENERRNKQNAERLNKDASALEDAIKKLEALEFSKNARANSDKDITGKDSVAIVDHVDIVDNLPTPPEPSDAINLSAPKEPTAVHLPSSSKNSPSDAAMAAPTEPIDPVLSAGSPSSTEIGESEMEAFDQSDTAIHEKKQKGKKIKAEKEKASASVDMPISQSIDSQSLSITTTIETKKKKKKTMKTKEKDLPSGKLVDIEPPSKGESKEDIDKKVNRLFSSVDLTKDKSLAQKPNSHGKGKPVAEKDTKVEGKEAMSVKENKHLEKEGESETEAKGHSETKMHKTSKTAAAIDKENENNEQEEPTRHAGEQSYSSKNEQDEKYNPDSIHTLPEHQLAEKVAESKEKERNDLVLSNTKEDHLKENDKVLPDGEHSHHHSNSKDTEVGYNHEETKHRPETQKHAEHEKVKEQGGDKFESKHESSRKGYDTVDEKLLEHKGKSDEEQKDFKAKERDEYSSKQNHDNSKDGYEPADDELHMSKETSRNQDSGKHEPADDELHTNKETSRNQDSGKHEPADDELHTNKETSRNQDSGKHEPADDELHMNKETSRNQDSGKHEPADDELHMNKETSRNQDSGKHEPADDELHMNKETSRNQDSGKHEPADDELHMNKETSRNQDSGKHEPADDELHMSKETSRNQDSGKHEPADDELHMNKETSRNQDSGKHEPADDELHMSKETSRNQDSGKHEPADDELHMNKETSRNQDSGKHEPADDELHMNKETSRNQDSGTHEPADDELHMNKEASRNQDSSKLNEHIEGSQSESSSSKDKLEMQSSEKQDFHNDADRKEETKVSSSENSPKDATIESKDNMQSNQSHIFETTPGSKEQEKHSETASDGDGENVHQIANKNGNLESSISENNENVKSQDDTKPQTEPNEKSMEMKSQADGETEKMNENESTEEEPSTDKLNIDGLIQHMQAQMQEIRERSQKSKEKDEFKEKGGNGTSVNTTKRRKITRHLHHHRHKRHRKKLYLTFL